MTSKTTIKPAKETALTLEVVSLVQTSPNSLQEENERSIVAKYLAAFNSEKTRQTMNDGIVRMLDIMKEMVGKPICREDVPWHRMGYSAAMAIRARLIERYRPPTVAVTLTALRGVLRTAWREKLMSHEDFHIATDWPENRATSLPAGRALSEEEVQRLRAFCLEDVPPFGTFTLGLFALLLGTGLRANEACTLTVDAYDPVDQTLRFLRKGRKEVLLSLGTGEAQEVEAWIALRKTFEVPLPWLFIRVWRDGRVRPKKLSVKVLEHMCKDLAHRAGLKHFSPHDCRRTFGTLLLERGIDLATVQRLMSHESPDTTARYDRRQWKTDAKARRSVTIWAEGAS